ncbi:MAG: site-specific DNA-methyltransferase [Gammaproteobacteria bacterium]|nr:site-specific DNA-methyltransferase [Gammaproteobacteria bacterium]
MASSSMDDKPVRSNSYSIDDALSFLRRIKDKGVAGIATSPPYNKAFNGRGRKPGSNWKNSKLMADNYSHFDDNMPEHDYIDWQRSILRASLECVGDYGVVLYNIGRKISNLEEDRRERIVQGFPVRQTIIWNRGSTHNHGGRRPSILPPIYELIYVIAGREWRLPERYLPEFRHWGDVWRVNFETKNPHPAPFPLELARRMAKLIDGPIADPLAGSGTMGIAALELGVTFYLNDLSPEYREMFRKRRRDYNRHKCELWNR